MQYVSFNIHDIRLIEITPYVHNNTEWTDLTLMGNGATIEIRVFAKHATKTEIMINAKKEAAEAASIFEKQQAD